MVKKHRYNQVFRRSNMKTAIFLAGLLSISVLAQEAPRKICKIVNVRPLTKEELEAKGIPQINYGTIYKQEMICQPKGDTK